MKYLASIFIALILVFPLVVMPANSIASASTIPTFSIVTVVQDQTVTIQAFNFPANDSFVVTMGLMGTRGVGGVQVATQPSGVGGSFQATYNIPASLHGLRQIAIRLQSPTSRYFAYNWFYNNTTGVTTPGPTPTPAPGVTPRPGYVGFPTFTITGVVRDASVTIRTHNLPPNDTFNVTMGLMSTRGVGGVQVATQASGAGGAQTFTYNIPASLHGLRQISIRMQSPTSGYFAYNWFYNNTTGVVTPATPAPGVTPRPGYVGFPTFTITGVVRDASVTIRTNNLPPNDTFVVTMGHMSTRGVGGVQVATQASGAGGAQTFTYNIPASLHGLRQISIRMQSPTSGYFAYNWFYNNTTP